jgi:hypothetical protein
MWTRGWRSNWNCRRWTRTYNGGVEKVVRKFNSFEEADRADADWYASLTPQQRIQIVIDLREQRHPDAASQPMARVLRVTRLGDE